MRNSIESFVEDLREQYGLHVHHRIARALIAEYLRLLASLFNLDRHSAQRFATSEALRSLADDVTSAVECARCSPDQAKGIEVLGPPLNG